MTKALFYTDYHLADKRPISRKDDFAKSQISKLAEIYETAENEKVDFILFGGDFFHKHRIYNYDLIHSVLDILEKSNCTTYAVIGQHDLIGHNKESYSKSTCCFMERYSRGKFKTLWEPLVVGDFHIHPCHWFDSLQETVQQPITAGKNSVLIAHQSITMKKYPFETILTKNIKSKFEVILSGDIHSGHEIHKIEATTFYNPGSTSRMSIKDKQRIPKMAILESGKTISIKEMEIKSAESDVFNMNSLEDLVGTNDQGVEIESKFFEEILALEAESADLRDLIQKIGVQHGIKSEVLEYISSKLATI